MPLVEFRVDNPHLTVSPTVELFGQSRDGTATDETDESTEATSAGPDLPEAETPDLSPGDLGKLFAVLMGIGVAVWLARRRS